MERILIAAKAAIPRGKGRGRRKLFWNDKCEQSVRKRNAARKEVERVKTNEAVLSYQRLKEDARRTIREEKSRAWEDTTAKMDLDSNLFSVIKAFRGEAPEEKAAIALEREGGHKARTDKEKADLFVQKYAEVSRVPRSKEDKETRRAALKLLHSG